MLSYCFSKNNQLKIHNYFINTTENDMRQEFRLKKKKEINNYFINEVN